MSAAYKGVVRDKVIRLNGDADLPEGTNVEVTIDDDLTPEGYRKGSREALLAYLRTPSHCTVEDVDALLEEIRQARLPTRMSGVFDQEH